jgi:hypothetical protein
MHPAEFIMEMVRQIRPLTVKWLMKPEDRHLMWAPEGLCNHVLWHAGHILWVNDALCIQVLTGKSQLPAGWAETFGMNCRPVTQTSRWPAREEMKQLLEAQAEQMLRLLGSTDEQTLTRVLDAGSGATVAGRIIHGLHDEAKHQGEIHLLIKQWRARNTPVGA